MSLLAPDLLERVLDGLGLEARPDLDLRGLDTVYAALCRSVPNDNIQKRIWFAGDRSTPVTGGDPTDFYQNWLRHGTGGTCYPNNGAAAALLEGLGFSVRRITSTVLTPGAQRGDANHGTVVATVDGADYLVDAQLAGFQALSLRPGEETGNGAGIHAMRAVPIEDGFEVRFTPGHVRDNEYRFQTEPEGDPADHARFLALYHRSAHVEGYSPFNTALYVCRHFDDSILTIHRGRRVEVDRDGSLTSRELDDAERRRMLVEELGISEEAAEALPPDEPEPARP